MDFLGASRALPRCQHEFILPALLFIVVRIRDEIGYVVQGTMCRESWLVFVPVGYFFTRQERKSCGFKYHTVLLFVVYGTSYHRPQVSMLLV